MSTAVNVEVDMMLDAAERVLRDRCTKELVDASETGEFPAALWQALEEVGLVGACVPQALGGVGLPLADALALLPLFGSHAAPVPLAEALVTGDLLARARVPRPPASPCVPVLPPPSGAFSLDAGTLSGSVDRVPFAAVARSFLVPVQHRESQALLVLERERVVVTAQRSIAGEPHGDVRFDRVPVAEEECFPFEFGDRQLRGRLALTRALLIAGAMQSILDLSCEYALERRQFGRPIAQFQAIQQQLAVLAGDTAASIRSTEVARAALGGDRENVEIAVAKSRAGEAAGRGAETAHQVHGAMGFTFEHRLHQRTRRLWQWRDEYGNEAFWEADLGRRIVARGADALFAFVTGTDTSGDDDRS